MKIQISFETGNASFEDDLQEELSRIFKQAQRKVVAQLARSPTICDAAEVADKLLDLNGNTVGRVRVLADQVRSEEDWLWSCNEGDEYYHHASLDDAVEMFLDDYDVGVDLLPATVTAYAYAPNTVSSKFLTGFVLERALEALDEEFGDPEEGYTKTTRMMIEAEQDFIEVLLSEYDVWSCYKVHEEEVNVREWLEKNRPDWLEEK